MTFSNGNRHAYSCLDPGGSSGVALPSAAFSRLRVRRCTSACRYLRRLSGTIPGEASSRRSDTVSSGRKPRTVPSGEAGVTHQREAHVVSDGPFAVPHDRRNHRGGKLFARERPQNLRFREVRIVEDDRDDLRVAFGEQSARHARRAAARQRNFLAERQLWQSPEQLILGVELQFDWNRGRKRNLDEIHQIKIPEKPQTDQAWRSRMKSER